MGIFNQPDDRAPRPPDDSRLKMHLRLLRAGGYTYRVVTLRPGTNIAFSTNFFHQTWHLVTSQRGAKLLARLLWGLSCQRHPGTMLLIHGDHLLPTPFEAERSDPFLLTVTGLTRLDASALRVLKSRLDRLGPPARTIRWRTFGLDAVLQGGEDGRSPVELEGERLRWKANERLGRQERMERRGGFIVYSAPPTVLRQQALRIRGLKIRKGDSMTEMDYLFLAERSSKNSWADGEVQIFADYMDRVEAAVQARQELVPNPNERVLSETVQEVVSRRRDQIKAWRARARRRHRGRQRRELRA